jgi:hypothetical protein
VRFGKELASDVAIVDDRTLTCTVPKRGPGVVDVTVENRFSNSTLRRGFAYTPAVTLDGTFRPGGDVNPTWLCEPGDALVGLIGTPPIRSLPTPPFHGLLCIDPHLLLFLLPSWPLRDFRMNLAIPNDPSLQGGEVLFQALIGSLIAGPITGAWTDCGVLRIE